jgi:hypothetical protein
MGSKLGESPQPGATVAVVAAGTAGVTSADIAILVGSTVADASVNTTARLLSIGTGLGPGETYVESLCVYKGGTIVGASSIKLSGGMANGAGAIGIVSDTANAYSTVGAKIHSFRNGGVEKAYIDKDGNVIAPNIGGGSGTVTSISVTTASGVSGTVTSPTTTPAISFSLGDISPSSVLTNWVFAHVATSSDKPVSIGSDEPEATIADDAPLLDLKVGLFGTPVNKVIFLASGQHNMSGSDSSGTPGDATIHKPSGISAMAIGFNTCVITNRLIPDPTIRRVRIMITPHAKLETWWVVQSAEAFTLASIGNQIAVVPFSWEINELITAV